VIVAARLGVLSSGQNAARVIRGSIPLPKAGSYGALRHPHVGVRVDNYSRTPQRGVPSNYKERRFATAEPMDVVALL